MNIKEKHAPFRRKEYSITVCCFLVLLTILLAVFLLVSRTTRLESLENDVDNVSSNMVAAFTRYIEEVNKASKNVFINETLFNLQDDYQMQDNPEEMYDYVSKQFEAFNSSLIVGMGYVPAADGNFMCNDIAYSGIKTISFNYSTPNAKELIDHIIEKGIGEDYSTGKMYLVYSDEWDLHIFARVVRDIRPDSFDAVRGVGFIVVNSTIFRQQRNVGNVIDGYSSYVTFDGETLLNDRLPTEHLDTDEYYVYKTAFSQYCVFYGLCQKTAFFKKQLADSAIILIAVAVVIVLFTISYKRIHDKSNRSFAYLIEEFRKSGDKSALVNIAPTEDDEGVNKVIETYNEMVNNYIAEKTKNESLQMKNSQIEQQRLSQQINKHFIINMLSVAHSLILLDKREEANECLENIADFLRYTLSINVTDATLKEEVDSAILYVKLQQVRFPNVSFAYDLEGDMDDVVVPKSIIQPLIENAYVHGLKNKRGYIKLKVCKSERQVKISVINSVESSQRCDFALLNKNIAELDSDEAYTGTGHGVALKNILRRLLLKFDSAQVVLLAEDCRTIAEVYIRLPEM